MLRITPLTGGTSSCTLSYHSIIPSSINPTADLRNGKFSALASKQGAYPGLRRILG